VSVSPIEVPRAFASMAEALELMATASTAVSELTSPLNDSQQAEVWSEIERRLQVYVSPDGRLTLPGEVLLAVGAAV
jgi:hypothetical protein